MKKLRIILINLLAVSMPSLYHLIGGNVWVTLLICNVAFSFADYLSYNWSIDPEVQWCNDCIPTNNLYEPYRVIQYILGIGLAAQLFVFFGWFVVIAFALWHFTFNNDNLFYLWHGIFFWFGEYRNAFGREILRGDCSWAFFTPVGIYHWIRTGNTGTKISGAVICFQSAIGIVLTTIIIIYLQNGR